MRVIKRISSFIYPPIGLIGVKRHLVGAPENFRENLEDDIAKNQYSEENKKEVFEWAKFIYESEIDRKEMLESKAQSYLVGLSIATGIIAAIPFLFSERWSLPSSIASLVAAMFALSIFYIVSAGYFALKTRQSGSFYLPGSDMFSDQIREHALSHEKNSSLLMLLSKNNESILTEKSNYLYVAEMSFVRAIIIVAVSVFIAVGSKLCLPALNIIDTSISERSNVEQMKQYIKAGKSQVGRLVEDISRIRDLQAVAEKEVLRLQVELDARINELKQASCADKEKIITIHCTRNHEAGVPFRYTPTPPGFMGR